ncbi:MAG TPA: hypothetical protein VLA96_00160 [Terriglobales bacterium]|nr:hypothetical protein [Terriglobales bacterium]
MNYNLRIAKMADGWFLACLGKREPEQWSSQRLHGFLVEHGYTEDDAGHMVFQAEGALEMEIYVPELGTA